LEAENAALRRKVRELEEEREILRKAVSQEGQTGEEPSTNHWARAVVMSGVAKASSGMVRWAWWFRYCGLGRAVGPSG
jgi:hypothetical protein